MHFKKISGTTLLQFESKLKVEILKFTVNLQFKPNVPSNSVCKKP